MSAGSPRIEHMFDLGMQTATLDAARVREWVHEVARASSPADDGSRLDLVSALEELKCAAEGLQGDLAVDVDASMRERAADRGVPSARQGQGVAAEIALARRESLHRGQRYLGCVRVGSTSGERRSSPGRPRASRGRTASRSTAESPATPGSWSGWATGSWATPCAVSPTSSTPRRG